MGSHISSSSPFEVADHGLRINNPLTQDVQTQNTTCSSGSIIWQYPEGRIRVHFPNVPDQLCITRGIAADDDIITNVYYEDGEQAHDLQFNADGRSCFNPTGTETSVVFEGPTRMRTYMASFAYELTSRDRGLVDRMQSMFNNFIHTAIRPFGNLLRKWNIQINIEQM
ncbi:uncharacterized protein LOC133187023 [Saccostrea echinata]|uniref:uncharacterized protein LOC133187023 n=1 Tax=Saccostrea echinata TaxID=191078 RepID=UPI002A8071BB|nr:uncharacterized protein LOC133187023 [Saccostrea echinata]